MTPLWFEKAELILVSFEQWVQSSASLWATAMTAKASIPLTLLSTKPGIEEKDVEFATRQLLLGDYLVLGGAQVTLTHSNNSHGMLSTNWISKTDSRIQKNDLQLKISGKKMLSIQLTHNTTRFPLPVRLGATGHTPA
jgi:hypothetical protein